MQEYIKQAEYLARGTEILPGGVNELAKKLKRAKDEDRPLRVKLGLDPTKPDLHLGHTVVMRKLKQYQELGHQVVLIIGDATAMIGDPSGKSETRKSLTKEEVKENAKTYLDQMGKVIDLTKAEVGCNSEWLYQLDLPQVLKLAAKATVAQLMTRDDFYKRYKECKPISLHELFYPLMQAYDSACIDADIEIGGTDQRFNVLMGRDLQHAYGLEPQIVQLLPLLEGTDGVIKMSKTYPDNCISLTDEPRNMYGKIMSIPDKLIIRYFELLTDISNEKLGDISDRLKSENPKHYKMELARTIVTEYHGINEAIEAEQYFKSVVSNKEVPSDISECKVEEGKLVVDIIVELGFVKSKSEAKRFIQGCGVKVNSDKISDINQVVSFSSEAELIMQVGKRKFVRLVEEK